MTITMGVIVITRPAVIIAPVPGIGCQHPQSWSIQPFIRQLYSHPVVLPSMHPPPPTSHHHQISSFPSSLSPTLHSQIFLFIIFPKGRGQKSPFHPVVLPVMQPSSFLIFTLCLNCLNYIQHFHHQQSCMTRLLSPISALPFALRARPRYLFCISISQCGIHTT